MGAGTRAEGWLSTVQRLLLLCGLCGLYLLAGHFAIMVSLQAGAIAPYYPAAGIALAALLLFKRRGLLVVIIGELLLQYTLQTQGYLTAVLVAGEALGALAAWELLTRRGTRDFQLLRSRDLGRLVAAGMLYGGLAATAGLAGLALGGEPSVYPLQLRWAIYALGDALGVLCIVPLVLAWQRPSRTRLSIQRAGEIAACAVTTLGSSLLTFTAVDGIAALRQPLAFPTFAVQVWAALRFGLRGAATATVAVSAVALYGTALGRGPFAGFPGLEQAIVLQGYVFLHSLMGLMLAVLLYERERAEAELLRQREYLRQIVDINPDIVFVKDRLHRYVFVNQALADLHGKTIKELLGRTDWDLAADSAAAALSAEAERAVLKSGEEHFVAEEPLLDAAGTTRWMQVVRRPLRDEFGIPRQVLGVATDITGRKLAEEQRQQFEQRMQQAQKLESMGVLAGGVAHDFNNLLAAILGNADLALLDLGAENAAAASIRRIRATALRASELASQMLAYSGKGSFVRSRFNLNDLLVEMLDLLQSSLAEGVVLARAFAPDLPQVEGDAAQLRQLIVNLLTNASDALADGGGRIQVRTAHAPDAAGRRVVLEVADTGQGMDAATRQRIFDPFFTTKFTGRGLGMAAVLGIVRGHNGEIDIESAPGQGTLVRVTLPAAETTPDGADAGTLPAAAAPQAAGSVPASAAERPTILIVDDDPAVCSVARRALARGGFRTLEAHDGARALELFRVEHAGISAVLLDLTMPEISGDEVLQQMLAIAPGVRVIVSSGYSEADVAARLGAAACAGFLQKPYEIRQLIETFQLLTAKGPAG